MAENITPEEAAQITGGDLENIADGQHPQGSLDGDMEGDGVSEPDIDSAELYIDLDEEDRDDIHLIDVNFKELESEDRKFYKEMSDLRAKWRSGVRGIAMNKEIEDLGKKFKAINQNNISESRKYFLGLIGNKLQVLYFESQLSKIDEK